MGRFRIVLLHNHGHIETRFVEKVEFEEIEEALRRDTVVGVFLGKE